jgi:hypothetical protein
MTPRTAASNDKENALPPPHYAIREAVSKVRPSVSRKPVPVFIPSPQKGREPKTPQSKRAGKNALGDSTTRTNNTAHSHVYASSPTSPTSPTAKVIAGEKAVARKFGSGSYDRVKAFERLKQMERSRFLLEDDDDDDLFGDEATPDEVKEGAENAADAEEPKKTNLEELEDEKVQAPAKSAADVDGAVVDDIIHEASTSITLAPKPSTSTALMTSSTSNRSIGDMSSSTKVDNRSKHMPSRTFERGPKAASSSFTLMTDCRNNTLVDRTPVVGDDVIVEEVKSLPLEMLARIRREPSPTRSKGGFRLSIGE